MQRSYKYMLLLQACPLVFLTGNSAHNIMLVDPSIVGIYQNDSRKGPSRRRQIDKTNNGKQMKKTNGTRLVTPGIHPVSCSTKDNAQAAMAGWIGAEIKLGWLDWAGAERGWTGLITGWLTADLAGLFGWEGWTKHDSGESRP